MTAPFYFYKQQLLKPEVYQAQLMAKFVQGKFIERGEVISPFFRAQVISFDQSGGQLENPAAQGVARSRNPESREYYDIPARVGPPNPPRSLRARVISNHIDANTADSDLRVFWPLFPPSGLDPVPLEFVYVFYEQDDRHHGLWVSRVPGPMGETVNFAPGSKPYEDAARNSEQMSLAAQFGDAPKPSVNYSSQQCVVGSKPDDSSLSKREFE